MALHAEAANRELSVYVAAHSEHYQLEELLPVDMFVGSGQAE
jgi:hypothetical protein